MGRKGKFAKKDKWAGLPDGFKDAIQQSSTDEIRKRVGEIALLDSTERAHLKINPDVVMARNALKNLMDPINENLKSYKLQISFCRETLKDKGGGATVSKLPSGVDKIEVSVAGHKTVTLTKETGDRIQKAIDSNKLQS